MTPEDTILHNAGSYCDQCEMKTESLSVVIQYPPPRTGRHKAKPPELVAICPECLRLRHPEAPEPKPFCV